MTSTESPDLDAVAAITAAGTGSRAGGTTPAAGPGPDGGTVERPAPVRPAAEPGADPGDRGLVPDAVKGPLSGTAPGARQEPARPGTDPAAPRPPAHRGAAAERADGLSPRPRAKAAGSGGGKRPRPASAPAAPSSGLAGPDGKAVPSPLFTHQGGGTAQETPVPVTGAGTGNDPGSAGRSSDAALPGGLSGKDALAEWKRQLAANAKAGRNRMGKRPAPGYGAGMNRRGGGGR